MKKYLILYILIISNFAMGASCRSDIAGACNMAPGPNPDACEISAGRACWVRSSLGLCRRIINSTGTLFMFIPARLNVELLSVPVSGTLFADDPSPTWCVGDSPF